jgi:hypothetical protein
LNQKESIETVLFSTPHAKPENAKKGDFGSFPTARIGIIEICTQMILILLL